MKELGPAETPKLKMKTLLFHRWDAEKKNRALSLPSGEYALALSMATGLPLEQAINGAMNYATQQNLALRRRIAESGDY